MAKLNGKTPIDFMGKKNTFALVSSIAVLVSLVLTFVPGPNMGIDFKGGTNIIARFSEPLEAEDVRSRVSEMGFADASVQAFGDQDGTQYLVMTQAVSSMTPERLEELQGAITGEWAEANSLYDEESGDRVYVTLPAETYDFGTLVPGEDIIPPTLYESEATRLAAELTAVARGAGFDSAEARSSGNVRDRRFILLVEPLQVLVETRFRESFGDRFAAIDMVETVGPRVGAQLRDDGIKAVLISLICILLYIIFRFDLRYAPGAVLALAHDVIITMGIFVIFKVEVSLPIIAALLTIVGYSLNDTIVNFDRIRENLELSDGSESLIQTVNRSLNECLSRTLLTSITTLLAVVAIFVFGGGLISTFALALLIGVVVGTYSSIFIASPAMIATSDYLDKRAEAELANMPA